MSFAASNNAAGEPVYISPEDNYELRIVNYEWATAHQSGSR
jgi:hypothetical protein